ncbi:TRAP transporter small permease subunit [uncultured Jannaschia sp.]|uniref:TRAP transporter small permease subunit n=1 Tax=uncultured Jannaschia sp. TaxID=293347 RepID=UPI0026197231|nr:TRAP transporter small permease subunit [uncultured Jannaschia sp.]
MLDILAAIGSGIAWIASQFVLAFYNLGYAITHPASWLAWTRAFETPEDKESLLRVVYYGASVEFLFVVLTVFALLTIGVGLSRGFGWRLVRGSEFALNWLGRIAAWAGLLMVLQQVMIVFLQRIFRVSEISIGPLGTSFTRDLSWYSEELKLYNAMIVCLCVAWTFIQGGHVRVDLVYSAVGHRAKRAIDMAGVIVFMMPALVLIWLYSWFFFWRSMITPATSASDPLDRMLMKARAVRWNVETISFSPNGFDAYFLFKVLILAFVVTAFAQACVFFWRSWLELREGEMSAGRFLDRDVLGDETAERAAEIH